jgi:hypothetical protein
MAAKSSAKGMVMATMSAPRTLPRKRKRMMRDQDDAFGEVVQDGVVVSEQVAAVEEGNDLDALGQDVSLSSSTLAWMPSRSVGVVALLQQDDAFDDIVVVDELAVVGWRRLFLVDLLDLSVGARAVSPQGPEVSCGLQVLPIWPRRILGP